MRFTFPIAVTTIALAITLSGCGPETDNRTADQKTQAKQETMQQQQVAQTGLPGITNFTEAKLIKHLYELRDTKVATYAYIPSYDGKLWHLCDSIGYGIPYATQFSNPEKVQNLTFGDGYHTYTLPQAEPNGLFMPSSADGTWVICSNPSAEGGIDPVYVEPHVIVSPHKLRSEGEYEIK